MNDITISDLADRIGMSRKTIWAWVRHGKLKSKRYGAQHRIGWADWQQFLAKCNPTITPTEVDLPNVYPHDQHCPNGDHGCPGGECEKE
jgi:excisionase family DNA binding protein